jgi:Tol biopolymer transport system component
MRGFVWALILLALGGFASAFYLARDAFNLPPLGGHLIFASDRSGTNELYWKDLSSGEERQLTYLNEPVDEPALSPDGTMVAFSMGGRIGIVWPATRRVLMLTLGVDWLDAAPSWRPDSKAILVSAHRAGEANADVHLLHFTLDKPLAIREPLTQTPGQDEQSPVFDPDGTGVVFAREDNLFRLDLKDDRTRRVTGGFRKYRYPRFLPSGKLLALWNEGKQYGIDVMEKNGKNRETIVQGSICYRTIAPSPDGRYLTGTFSFDLAFDPRDAFKLRQTEEVRLLDAHGHPLGTIERSWRYGNHSAEWAR